ncbi:SemiSWEET transporter [Mangrovivirga cuniculi]|uniref:SemiSWEET transporter n=1 Tax=Mangrovivirga cuniculi TaxID=2715131 RepID=UPI001C30CA11|nr:SemiSWEET transporter [Mangrovivirga cuniculi]
MIDWKEIIGIVAGCCTTIAFLPQVIKTWRTKSARDLSLSMFLIFFTGVLLWLIYGIVVADLPVILANSATLFLAGILLFFKVIYK